MAFMPLRSEHKLFTARRNVLSLTITTLIMWIIEVDEKHFLHPVSGKLPVVVEQKEY